MPITVTAVVGTSVRGWGRSDTARRRILAHMRLAPLGLAGTLAQGRIGYLTRRLYPLFVALAESLHLGSGLSLRHAALELMVLVFKLLNLAGQVEQPLIEKTDGVDRLHDVLVIDLIWL